MPTRPASGCVLLKRKTDLISQFDGANATIRQPKTYITPGHIVRQRQSSSLKDAEIVKTIPSEIDILGCEINRSFNP